MIRLNLLPPERLRNLATETIVARWRAAAWLTAGLTLFVLAGFLSLSFVLRDRRDTLKANVHNLEQQFDNSDSGAIRRRIQTLNTAVKLFDEAVTTDRPWARDLTAILGSLPDKTQLTELTLTADGNVSLIGVSKVRADFLAFDEAIKKNPLLTQVKTDSTASRRENVPYRYTASFITPTP